MITIRVAPGKEAKVFKIENKLEALQKAVDGYIEVIYPFEDEVGLVCNEEGKLLGLDLNRPLYTDEGEIYDVIAGTFLVVGLSKDSFRSLTYQETEKYLNMFKKPISFIRTPGGGFQFV